MATFFERLMGRTDEAVNTQLREAIDTASTLAAQVTYLDMDRADLKESMRELSLYLEDLRWIPVDGWQEEKGFPIEVIKQKSDEIRALLSINPTIKKAVNARVGYIWGNGVTFKGNASRVNKVTGNVHNQDIIFDETAKWALEAQLATDGNLWASRDSVTDEVTIIPIEQIAGWVVDPNDPVRVNYWLREYDVVSKNFSNGVETAKHIRVFIPNHGYTGNKVSSIDGITVDKKSEMIHVAVNRQSSWILGIPDIMAAMFWAKGHKELFEAGTAFVKAQGRYASKVIAKTGAGAQRAAAAVATAPRRDEQSGEILDIGGTAVMSAGMDMQLMGKMSGGVDFEAFDPVAGLIAVGLGIPLYVLLGNSPTAEESLEETTVEEMKQRQKLWSWFFKAIIDPKVDVVWPKIKSEPTYRQIQSIEISNKSNTLSPVELRQLTLEAYGLQGDPNKLPDIEKNNAYLLAKAIADNAASNAQDLAQQNSDAAAKIAASTPEQGVDAGIGKLSTGKDSKNSRNNKSDTNTKSQ